VSLGPHRSDKDLPDDGAPASAGRLALVLGSASPGRAEILTRARVPFRTLVSHVDEEAVGARAPQAAPGELALLLAEAKGQDVAAQVVEERVQVPTLVVGCDSVFELDGTAYGKPYEPAVAIERWRLQQGQTGMLHTGQWVGLVRPDGTVEAVSRRVSAAVTFAEADERTIAAYVATGEPLWCAGAFTVDGAGAALVESVEGDPNAVIGLSVSTLRVQCEELGVPFASLWESSNSGR